MLPLAFLLMAVLFVLIPWADKTQKRRNEEWKERRKRLMAIGADDDEVDQPSSVPTNRPLNLQAETPPESNAETGNPYQPPSVSHR